MGRPTKFNISLSAKIAALYGAGKTDKQVADAIGVAVRTLQYWKASQPEFLHSLKEGKDVADELVVSSLFRRATGYTHPEEKIFQFEGRVVRAKTSKHYPPDVTAAIYWLKNRRPEEWRDPGQPLPVTPDLVAIGTGLKTFTEFCVTAGYFVPFKRQEDMRAFGFDETETRLLLGARGYGKTDYVTIMGLAYDLYKAFKAGADMSEHTTLIITKSKPRNAAIVNEITEALKKNGVPLDKANTTLIRVKGLVGQDHSVEAITIKTSMRGRHPKRIVMDDPVTDEDVSEAMRILVKKKYDEAYKLCKNMVIIGQPAHFDDLYAQLRDLIKTMLVPHGEIPELDQDLEAMKRAGIDLASIQMSYLLTVPTDGTSPFAKIKRIDKLPAGEKLAYIDPSEGGDYTAVSVFMGHLETVAVEGRAWKKAWYHCTDELVELFKELGVKRVCFETNKFGQQPVGQLQQLLGPLGIGVVGRTSSDDKHAAIMSAGSYADMIHLSRGSDKAYTDQVIKYEYNAKFDDAPDSLARGLQWIGLLKGKRKQGG